MTKDIKDITRFVRGMQGTKRFKKFDAFTYQYLQKQIKEFESIKKNFRQCKELI